MAKRKHKIEHHHLSFRAKILLYTILVLFTATLTAGSLVTRYERQEAYREVLNRAKALSTALEPEVTHKILIDDYVGLEKLFQEILRADPTVSYLFVEKKGNVLVHTFEGGFPVQLLGPIKRGPEGEAKLISQGNLFIDLKRPLWKGRAGQLHLGLKMDYIMKQTMEHNKRIALASLLVFLFFAGTAYVFSGWIVRPLKTLTSLAESYSKGDYSSVISYKEDDEIGKLCDAFNKMREAISQREEILRQKNIELKEANAQLKKYIEELNRTTEELIKLKQDTTVQETVRAVLHHLRQPLTVVLGYIEILEEEISTGEATTQRIEEISKKIASAGKAIAEILKKIETLKKYRVVRFGDDIRIVDIDTD